MEFWLSFNNFAEKLQLPVNPKEYRIKTGNKNDVVDIQSLGELNLIGGEKLAEIQLSSFFPANWAPYCSYKSIPDPYDAVDTVEKWRKSGRPVRLIITPTPINLACSIEDFEYGESGGVGDVIFTLSLKEYRFIQVRQVGESVPAGQSAVRPVEKTTPKTYQVRTGDSLFLIAKKVYGNSDKWRDLFAANTGVIGKDPNLIKPGQQLVIA